MIWENLIEETLFFLFLLMFLFHQSTLITLLLLDFMSKV